MARVNAICLGIVPGDPSIIDALFDARQMAADISACATPDFKVELVWELFRLDPALAAELAPVAVVSNRDVRCTHPDGFLVALKSALRRVGKMQAPA